MGRWYPLGEVFSPLLLRGSRPIALAVSGRMTSNAVGLLPFSEGAQERGQGLS